MLMKLLNPFQMSNEVAHIKEYQLMNVDSNEMTPRKMA